MDPMDPDEWDEDAAAMAEAMGFSSFGGQNHPSKRRKYNARADAAFDSNTNNESTLALHYDAGSGSNNTPLGERRPQQPKPKKQKTNANEIDLDDDDDDDDDGQDGGEVDGNDAVAAGDQDDAQDPTPQHITTSQPPDQIQSGIDAIVAGLPRSPRGLPLLPSAKGGRDGDRWWDDYYDPAFNTNPWEKIEKKLGIEARGTWLSYDESKAKWTTIQSQSSSTAAAATTTEAAAAQAA
ncbi:uncharacterized protein PG998_009921 [Apiospora kogelbergensis]|uniref:uncharacterized protein n=1 Tax=Apiospora kogelbergensis TaxID=1337665 RepID=UPI0031317FB0